MKLFPKLFKKTAKGAAQVWQISVEEGKGGTGVMTTVYGQVDGKMQETVETIRHGKNVGRRNETTPYEQACTEAESRWNKQKDRKGYGLTLAESAAVRAVSPMLAHTYEKHSKKVDWASAFAQPKLDGFRCLAHIDAAGNVKLLSRENQPFTVLHEIQAALERAVSDSDENLPSSGVIFDGELYAHGMSLNEISSACKKRSDRTKRIAYHVYDGVVGDMTFSERYKLVSTFLEQDSLLVPVKTVKVRSESDLMVAQSEFVGDGYEGAMLRYGRVAYQAGKRSDKLLKVKTFEDDEFEVVDFKMGRGRYDGVPVFMCKTRYGHLFDVTAPGTMEEKRAFGANLHKWLGKKLTVKFQHFTKTDAPVPFLPVAIRFRDE